MPDEIDALIAALPKKKVEKKPQAKAGIDEIDQLIAALPKEKSGVSKAVDQYLNWRSESENELKANDVVDVAGNALADVAQLPLVPADIAASKYQKVAEKQGTLNKILTGAAETAKIPLEFGNFMLNSISDLVTAAEVPGTDLPLLNPFATKEQRKAAQERIAKHPVFTIIGAMGGLKGSKAGADIAKGQDYATPPRKAESALDLAKDQIEGIEKTRDHLRDQPVEKLKKDAEAYQKQVDQAISRKDFDEALKLEQEVAGRNEIIREKLLEGQNTPPASPQSTISEKATVTPAEAGKEPQKQAEGAVSESKGPAPEQVMQKREAAAKARNKQQPKRVTVQSMLRNSIKSSHLKEHGISNKEDKGIFLILASKNGKGLDEWADELIGKELPEVPGHNPTDALIWHIRNNTVISEAGKKLETVESNIPKKVSIKGESDKLKVDDLDVGDQFTINGEKYHVTDTDYDAGVRSVELKDGLRYRLDEVFQPEIDVDKGSFKSGMEIIESVGEKKPSPVSTKKLTEAEEEYAREQIRKGNKPEMGGKTREEKREALRKKAESGELEGDMFYEKGKKAQQRIDFADVRDYGGEQMHFVDPTVEEVGKTFEKIKKAVTGEPTSDANQAAREIVTERTGDINWGAHKAHLFREEVNADIKKVIKEQPLRDRLKAFVKGKDLSKELKEELIYYIQKTGNPYKPGDTFETLKTRIPNDARLVADKIRTHLDDLWKVFNDSEYMQDVSYIEDYITQMYTGKSLKKKAKQTAAYLQRKFPYAKQRKFESYHEAITKAGLTPRFTDAGQIVQFYENLAYRVMANNKMIDSFKKMETTDGKAIIYTANQIKKLDPEIGKDYIEMRHPMFRRLYAVLHKGEEGEITGADAKMQETVYVHPEVYKPLARVITAGFDMSSGFGAFVKAANAIAKKTMLSISFFHHLALTESSFATGGWNIYQSIRRGNELIRRMDPTVEQGIRNGLMVEATNDIHLTTVQNVLNRFEKASKQVPLIHQGFMALNWFNTKWDKALWDSYHRMLKLDAYNRIYEDNLERFGDKISEKQLAQEAAAFVNDAFGGQNWDSYTRFTHFRMGEQVVQLLFLAPDWGLSNLKIAARGIGGLAGLGPKTVRRKALGYWARAGAMFTIGQQMAQFGFYQANLSEEEKKKYSPWMWDNAPDKKFAINTFRRDSKGRFLYIKPLKQAREVLRYFDNFIEITGSKLSPIAREAVEQYAGHSPGSQFEQPYAGMDFWESVPTRIRTMFSKIVPLSMKGNSFFYSLPQSTEMNNYNTAKLYTKALRAWAEEQTSIKRLGEKKFMNESEILDGLKEITYYANRNNLDSGLLFKTAVTALKTEYYSNLFKALNQDNMPEVEKWSKAVLRIGGSGDTIDASLRRKYERLLREDSKNISKEEALQKLSNLKETLGKQVNVVKDPELATQLKENLIRIKNEGRAQRPSRQSRNSRPTR